MSSAPTADEIARDARWLAQALDPPAGLVRLVEMTPESYRAASFLDDRMFHAAQFRSLLKPWADVDGAFAPEARRDARWIFHIGHVGSTLVSRLLGELDGVLALREPRSLRDLTFFPPEVRRPYLAGLQALMSRTFAPSEAAVVKATSMVSEIAAELVGPGGRALFLHAAPRRFIQGLLAGDNSRQELRLLASARAARMQARRVPALGVASDAQLAAAAWACEMTALEAAAEAMPQPPLWSDFDALLGDLGRGLAEIASHLGVEAAPERLQQIAAGPLTRRYSKALEYEYSADLREELLAEAERSHGRDIADAVAMLEKAARESPLLERALARASSEN